MRGPNAIDFWRGYALICIFIDHIPGNPLERITMRNFTICDAAELFVFLAGWSVSLATGGPTRSHTPGRITIRFMSRMVEVYRAQITITAIALAILAGAALWLENNLYLEWHNAEPVFTAPVWTTPALALMTHQLGFFNILPLYVVLLAMAPLIVIIGRYSLTLCALVSFAVYAVTLTFRINLPSWPYAGEWFLDPFAWQFLFTLGFIGAELSAQDRIEPLMKWLFWPAVGILGLGVLVRITGYSPDPMQLPSPRLFFSFDKTYLSPARLISLLALVICFAGAYSRIAAFSERLVTVFSELGRNSLAVFSIGSLLSLIGQIVRFESGGLLIVDLAYSALGIGLMIFTAWFVEWRTRSKRPPSQSSASPA
ncbi:OpgC protein [Methyloligella halotolerans]|uniref:OpgC protein n=1 Tax=Methyloligella halotolerans TaxID=1177755 RepID=A0A1E2S081_9HYPH|nr:OpgC domain-containing protein [Methyloligella halotolerans]ODA67903.1 OpgC protein [Methyloligella halotolerans]